MTDTATAFDQNTLEYDQWFEKHLPVYQSEILAILQAIPENKTGIEIGVGTGRFAEPLKIKVGVEPSEKMSRIAEQRGITVHRAYAENLPIENSSYDFALMVTTVCFLSDIPKAFSEVHRILKSHGKIILGIIDKYSELGKKYEMEKFTNKFYKYAYFQSTEELTEILKQSGFNNFQYWQTLTEKKEENPPCACYTPDNLQKTENEIEQPKQGFGQGSFVVIKANKV